MSINCFFRGCDEEVISSEVYDVKPPDTNSKPPEPQEGIIFIEDFAKLETITKIKFEIF